ncbi:RNA polymerase sporulation sigma factor SigE [Butyricicoccus pullicaecorum]|uniref:RNA polymerase sigma factor n=2 Tax=Butyricicoccus pullicaecorum TaxID=501571 RepID=R8W5R1_9FIRM|nr:RNA polymerase sporulation sigma factor SigE [Butyricicoccus pullicaecorum]EOQ38462.1 RNA polymerase sigma-E factor [Butyricicoccus pullicaecorum 1.2]OUP52850.1 RNA polymerase sporulation sigma factor SigE [Butyricicoccus pullicaecorum]OUP57415.1 RNA polymerase sporulation sigma factor SigE [Butyricicoccus pullicaecorum]SKA53726.1 RNA polymerase sporulation-specific sigma factor [Butyricicoccus pullicaecorum DSM 23266]
MKKWLRRILARLRALCSGGIYYIGGSEVLPPPLTGQDEADCIARLMAGDPEARDALVEHNLRLVVYIARKFENTGVGVEDLISIGTIGLMKAVGTYKTDKNVKLATYASRCIENEILMHLRKVSGQRAEVSFDEPLSSDWDGNELLLSDILGTEPDSVIRPIEDDVDRELLRQALSQLPPREKQIICLRFGLGGRRSMTQKEVADLLGISQSYISRLEKRIISRMKKEILRWV